MGLTKSSTCIILTCGVVAAAHACAGEQETRVEEVLVSASRTNKPISAIPNTVKVIDRQALDAQLATSRSLLDGLSFVVPSLTPAHFPRSRIRLSRRWAPCLTSPP